MQHTHTAVASAPINFKFRCVQTFHIFRLFVLLIIQFSILLLLFWVVHVWSRNIRQKCNRIAFLSPHLISKSSTLNYFIFGFWMCNDRDECPPHYSVDTLHTHIFFSFILQQIKINIIKHQSEQIKKPQCINQKYIKQNENKYKYRQLIMLFTFDLMNVFHAFFNTWKCFDLLDKLKKNYKIRMCTHIKWMH